MSTQINKPFQRELGVAQACAVFDASKYSVRTHGIDLIMDAADGIDVWVQLLLAGQPDKAQEMYDLAFASINVLTDLTRSGVVVEGLAEGEYLSQAVRTRLHVLIDGNPGVRALRDMHRLRQAMRDLHAQTHLTAKRGAANLAREMGFSDHPTASARVTH